MFVNDSKVLLAVGAVAFVAVMGCSGDSQEEVRIHGSSTVYPISAAVAEEFGREHPRIKVTVGSAGTSGGMKKLWQGEIDICDASREMYCKKRCATLCSLAGWTLF